jgi:gliding motility-associated-like protein
VILYPESIVSYRMSVYDRYGGLLFETEDPDQGWNGRKGSRDLPMGTYAYIIRATQSNGRQLEEKGTITLIR